MKKQFDPLLLIAIIGILLSSCGNLSKLSFTKRHYRSGYYVDFGGKNKTTPIIPTSSRLFTKPKQQTLIPVITAKPKEPGVVNTSKALTEKLNSAQKIVVPKQVVKNDKIISTYSTPNTITHNTLSYIYGNSEAEHEADAQVNVNVSYAVIIICAIFIPPLGVALMYGIHGYFWIDLILTLLFFFPGMIFALIVVLM